VDNHPYLVDERQDLLRACLSLGLNLPYFCWHPAMGSVGACRQCAVKIFKDASDTRGRIVMACMTPVTDGMRISIDDPEARAFRARIIEWLMVNHPHDCPVCDEGGECHLQDMTVMTGHAYRRYRFRKRTYRNQDLGPFVAHEMNRCIQCYRCVRFYRDFAGGRDLETMGWHDHVYFGRSADGPLQSKFAGNLVEVCPTGVFTDKTLYRHYTRKWDLQTAPSVCVHCSVGCSTLPGERRGVLRRVRARFNHEVNGYFLCDRGRYGYEFVNSDKRLRKARLRRPGGAVDLSMPQAAAELGKMLAGDEPVCVASGRASLESIFALSVLAGGSSRMFAAMGPAHAAAQAAALDALAAPGVRAASLADIAAADAVLLLGQDPTHCAPMVALAVRQAARNLPKAQALARTNVPQWNDAAVRDAMADLGPGPLYIASPRATELDDVAAGVLRASPADIALAAQLVKQDLAGEQASPAPAELSAFASRAASALRAARRPLVVAETLSAFAPMVRQAGATPQRPCELAVMQAQCNSMGLALTLRGERVAGALERAADVDAIVAALGRQEHTLVVLEADLYRCWTPEQVERVFQAARAVVALDCVRTPTTDRAELALPCASFAEGDGTMVNFEGRAQRFFRVMTPREGEAPAAWRWLGAGIDASPGGRWANLDAILAELAQAHPLLAPAVKAAPDAQFRLGGQRVPRQTHRNTGRAAIGVHESMVEPRPPRDVDSPLAFSMEGYSGQPPAPLLTNIWAPGWNSAQALNKFQQEVGGPLRGGPCGVRLIEPGRLAPAPAAAATNPPAAQLLAVPMQHAFGSEPLSAHAPGIASLAPEHYVAVREVPPGLAPGDVVEMLVDGRPVYRAPLTVDPSLAPGLAAAPAGVAPAPAWDGPVPVALRAAKGNP
jgi:NADH-quinone oxidoreductase subunit G